MYCSCSYLKEISDSVISANFSPPSISLSAKRFYSTEQFVICCYTRLHQTVNLWEAAKYHCRINCWKTTITSVTVSQCSRNSLKIMGLHKNYSKVFWYTWRETTSLTFKERINYIGVNFRIKLIGICKKRGTI